MGIEGGIEGGGPSFETAPVMVGNFSTIVNEGPVRGSLEGFRLMNASDINTIDKGGTVAPSGLSVVKQAKAVAAKAWEASESLAPTEAVSQAETIIALIQQKPVSSSHPELVAGSTFAKQREALLRWIPLSTDTFDQVRDDKKVVVIPQVEPGVLPVQVSTPDHQLTSLTKPQTESRVYHQGAPAVSPQPLLQEQEVEEIVTEKITQEETGMVEKEEMKKVKRRYVVDERALSQVVVEFKAAVRKARELAGKLGIKISGKLISKFLPGQHPGNESEAVKGKGPDGSIPARQQSVEGLGELSLDTQAEEEVGKVAYEKPPIKIRSEGEPVSDVDVARVFKYHVVKPAASTYEIVTKRIKKKVPVVPAGQVAQTQTEARVETSLEDYPDLADVFKH